MSDDEFPGLVSADDTSFWDQVALSSSSSSLTDAAKQSVLRPVRKRRHSEMSSTSVSSLRPTVRHSAHPSSESHSLCSKRAKLALVDSTATRANRQKSDGHFTTSRTGHNSFNGSSTGTVLRTLPMRSASHSHTATASDSHWKQHASAGHSSHAMADASDGGSTRIRQSAEASFASRRDFEQMRVDELAPLCSGHRMPMKRFKVRKANKNHGRWFWSCQQSTKCKSFKWESELDAATQKRIQTGFQRLAQGTVLNVGLGQFPSDASQRSEESLAELRGRDLKHKAEVSH